MGVSQWLVEMIQWDGGYTTSQPGSKDQDTDTFCIYTTSTYAGRTSLEQKKIRVMSIKSFGDARFFAWWGMAMLFWSSEKFRMKTQRHREWSVQRRCGTTTWRSGCARENMGKSQRRLPFYWYSILEPVVVTTLLFVSAGWYPNQDWLEGVAQKGGQMYFEVGGKTSSPSTNLSSSGPSHLSSGG